MTLFGGNLLFLLITILQSHQPLLLIASFFAFGVYFRLTRSHQGTLQPKGAILVGGFLAALTLLTAEQGFWLKPVLNHLKDLQLYLSAMALTGVTDNAALTALAAQVPDLSESARYLVLAGAVAGGGLTLIANAPNPAGFSILKPRFQGVLNAGELLKWAILPTAIAGGFLWIHS
jgi:predicted cation transporter